MKYTLLLFCLFLGLFLSAQTEQELEEENAKDLAESTNITWEGNKQISEENFVEAEKEYRKAISKSNKNVAAPFNLGNAYYNKETYSEAFGRFKEAGERSVDKGEKHRAYHNMGNVFMKRKEYEKAVEAYKEALRNNPKDEETRYNLALAKEMLKKEQDEQKQDEQKQDDENKDEQDQDDKKDDQEKNEDEKDDGDKKEDEGDKEEENEDKKDEGDKGDEEKEDNKEGDGDKKEEQEQKPEEQQQQPPRPNQLSKQQIQNLLDAMQNEEDKVQEKIDAQKVQGVKVKTEKDW